MGYSAITRILKSGGGRQTFWNWNPFKNTGSKFRGGNNLVIMGSTVLLFIACFVGGCGGKPFHSAGQAEVEEDTTQNSMKEKFPESLALALAHEESLIPGGKHPVVPGILLGGNDVDSDADIDDLDGYNGAMENGASYSYSNYPSTALEESHPHYRHYLQQQNNKMIGMLNKRSRIGLGRGLPFDGVPGNEDILDDEGFSRPTRLRPDSLASPSSSSPSDIINSSGESTTVPKFRIRQKIANLRNQYGDKWLAFVGPYAYRKRQILYRQCFFNPISCF